jgi:hypothetical protein
VLTLLLKILNIHVEQAGRLVHWSISPHGTIWMGWLILVGAILCGGAFWVYHRSAAHLDRNRRLLLIALRCALFLLILGIMARPVLALTMEASVRNSLQIMVDASQSMGIPDLRSDDADLKRAGIAKNVLDPEKGLDQPLDPSQASGLAKVSRMDLVHSVLNNPALGLLAKLKVDYTLQPYTFGDELREMTADDANDWVNTIAATEPLTRIGDAVMDALSRMRGQPSTGIFLITDGQSNSGRSIVQAAEQAKLEGVPLFIYGVGIDQPKDIIVSDLFTRDVAFVKDSLPVSVRVRSPGFAGQSADVVLRLGDKTVDTEHITFDASAEQVVVMKFTPSQKGTYTLKASIDPRPDEASKDNNEASQPLKVVDDKIKVLYVERQPRWEFKYLVAMLMRDRRVDFKTLLLEADPSVTEGENSPFLKEFPTDADALTKFDLIILGDVDPRTFTEVQLTAMQHWVQQGGGGLLFIAGRRDSASSAPSVRSRQC